MSFTRSVITHSKLQHEKHIKHKKMMQTTKVLDKETNEWFLINPSFEVRYLQPLMQTCIHKGTERFPANRGQAQVTY